MKKRLLTMVTACILTALLSGCASKEAKELTEKIATLASAEDVAYSDITEIESLYEAVSDKENVENYEQFTAIESSFADLQKSYSDAVEAYNSDTAVFNELAYAFNEGVDAVTEANQKLADEISDAQKAVTSGKVPYDETTIKTVNEVVAEADAAKVDAPDKEVTVESVAADDSILEGSKSSLEEAIQAIQADTQELESSIRILQDKEIPTPKDYSKEIKKIKKAKKAFNNSVKINEQITAPSEDFVITKLQGIKSITGIQAVTEDHDPNGQLNKSGGYTATVYFTDEKVDQSNVYGDTIIDKGTAGGGAVEVYRNVEDAQRRCDYLASYDGTVLATGSHTVLGTMVLRTSDELTASKQNELEAEMIRVLTSLSE